MKEKSWTGNTELSHNTRDTNEVEAQKAKLNIAVIKSVWFSPPVIGDKKVKVKENGSEKEWVYTCKNSLSCTFQICLLRHL